MPKAMEETDIDPIADQVDREMQESGQVLGVTQHSVDLAGSFGDLSDGGKVGNVRVIPVDESGRVNFDKKKQGQGRPTVRNVWRWDGAPSTIPLAYDPSGKTHDGGRRYLLKRHCPLCKHSGFMGQVCLACRKDGRRLVPVVALYYLNKKDVPERQQFYGEVNCFVPTCIRRGEFGFLNEAQMLQHGMSRHRLEYKAYQDSRQNRQDSELDALRQQVAALTVAQLNGAQAKPERTEEQKQQARDRMAKARAGRK